MAHIIGGEKYLTTVETARRIGVLSGTVRNWRADGRTDRLPHLKLGAAVLYKESDVEAYLAKRGT